MTTDQADILAKRARYNDLRSRTDLSESEQREKLQLAGFFGAINALARENETIIIK